MKKTDEYDCVRLKWDIQQQLIREHEGMNPQQVRQSEQEQIAADPMLGPFLQKLVAPQPVASRSPN